VASTDNQEFAVTEPSPPPSASPPQGPPPPHREPPPPTNAGWAVAALLFFWPLSFSAFSHAFNVYPLWVRGDVAGAMAASDRVRRLGQLSLWLFGGLCLLLMICYVAFVVALIANGDGPHHWPRDYED
jgi:hypothetical protein